MKESIARPSKEQKLRIQNLFFIDKLEVDQIAQLICKDKFYNITNIQNVKTYIFNILRKIDKNVDPITVPKWHYKNSYLLTEEDLFNMPTPKAYKFNNYYYI